MESRIWLWHKSLLLPQRRRRWKQDLCKECGYDLRGSVERCPECGAKIVRDPKSVQTMTVRDERR